MRRMLAGFCEGAITGMRVIASLFVLTIRRTAAATVAR
jgi:hypothetical protein